MRADDPDHICDSECWTDCFCGRGRYKTCRHTSCYDCYLDRRSEYVSCIFCGNWHSPDFDTCFKCRPLSRGRDDAARALRQLILWRDDFKCRYCGGVEGEMQYDPRTVRPRCLYDCRLEHEHRVKDSDGLRHIRLHVDHIVPCAQGGKANEWNLQTLCSVCNTAKGSTWYPGCRHDVEKTKLCRVYFLMARSYFTDSDREEFLAEREAYRATGTWDPDIHAGWRAETQEAA